MQRLTEPTLAKAVDATASALLRGARGNSGVILSLLFRGMAKKLHEKNDADGCDFAIALREGVETAYKAVMKPAEGTILTVTRVAAQHAVELCQSNPALSVHEVFEAVLERGQTALAETTKQNPVLEKAGVVDAGGFGFLVIFEGMFDAFRGIQKKRPKSNQARPLRPRQISVPFRTRISLSPTAQSSSRRARTRRATSDVCVRSSAKSATLSLLWRTMILSRYMCTPTSPTRCLRRV